MADTVIENLITKLTFDFDDKKLEKFDEHLKNAVKGLTAIVVGATAAATGIFAFTKKIAESNDELMKFAQRTGVDIKALQDLGYVAELNGGSIDSMNSSLENLARISSEAARGMGAGVEVFGMLGISVTDSNGRLKEADVMLNNVSDAISRLGSQAQRLEFAQKLGIGPDLLIAIQQGSEAIKRQRQEARELGFVIDQDAGKAAADFVDEMLRVNKVISGVANAIGTRLIKHFNKMNGQFIEWFKTNKKLIQQNISLFLDKAISTIKGVFNIVRRVVGVVLSLINAMGGLKNTIILVTGLLLTMNASALLMPILLVAVAAGILLLLEDIIKFAEGGDSAIGQLANKFPVLDAVLRTILDLLAMVRDGWTLIFTDGGEALEGLIMMIKDFGSSITDFFLNPINKAFDLMNKIPGINIGGVGAGSQIMDQARSPGSIQNNNAVSNTTVNKPNVSINIHGGDTDKVRQVVKDVLNEQYSGAQTNLESQVEF
jgi:methyl-accepting chemotaxis protein